MLHLHTDDSNGAGKLFFEETQEEFLKGSPTGPVYMDTLNLDFNLTLAVEKDKSLFFFF